ncbi:MAG TPA: amidohydrolase family protein [Streptosporangiaceae bacterium]|nr:amidohydrolase family protein [Streptosporangiaceae bacterium]
MTTTPGPAVDEGIEFTFHNDGPSEVTLLPDPPRARRHRTIISVDDHLVEPPDTFSGRIPAKFAERAPRIVPTPDGRGEAWLYDGTLMPNIGLSAVVGRPAREWGTDPVRFADMRRGAWSPTARLADMDLDGVYASVNFPSFLPGFGGARLQTVTPDRELALACVRAWNDWLVEEWAGADPARFIPVQLPWLHDPELGAAEIRRNAARGFKAVTFPEHPERSGFPTMFTGHWDPIMRACAETQTVVCIHTGSGGSLTDMGAGAPPSLASLIFGSYALIPTSVWLYSMLPVRFPELKICVAEGGISWVPGLLDRMDHLERHRQNRAYYGPWFDVDISPAEVLRRNFWFCAVDDPSAWSLRHRIGVERIMLEVDYPHPDSNWPNTQAVFAEQLKDVPAAESELISWRNASDLFRHPVPRSVQDDPDSF